MSLIFKALKKLKAPPPRTTDGNGSPLQKSSNVFSFRRIFFSPLVILLLFITGFFAYYLFQLLLTSIHQGPGTSSSAVTSFQQQPAISSQQDNAPGNPIENIEIPNHPENLPTAELQPGYQPTDGVSYLQNNPIEPPADGGRIQYIGKGDVSADASSGIPQTPAKQTEPVPDMKNRFYGSTNTAINTGWANQTGNEPNSNNRMPGSPPNIPIKKEELLVRIKIEKGRKIASLASRIEESLTKQDYQQTEQLIEKLGDLTDEDNAYLLKIKSFLYLKTGRYEQAGSILQRVLSKNKKDLEANINMAIIETKTGKGKDAHSRLVELAEIYPDNSAIQNLIHKLK